MILTVENALVSPVQVDKFESETEPENWCLHATINIHRSVCITSVTTKIVTISRKYQHKKAAPPQSIEYKRMLKFCLILLMIVKIVCCLSMKNKAKQRYV